MTTAVEPARAPGLSPPTRRRWSLPGYAIQALSLAAGIGLWEMGASALRARWLPPFSDVVNRLAELWQVGELPVALVDSLLTLALSYAISAVIGVGLGAMMATIPLASYALLPYTNALLATPALVLAPVFFVFFGLSQWTLVAIILVFTVPTILLSTMTALAGADKALQEMAYSFGARSGSRFLSITLRSALPLVFVGLRLGLARSVKGMVTGQLVVTVVGLGGIASHAVGTFDAAAAMGIAVVTVVIALVATGAIQVVDRRVNSWVD